MLRKEVALDSTILSHNERCQSESALYSKIFSERSERRSGREKGPFGGKTLTLVSHMGAPGCQDQGFTVIHSSTKQLLFRSWEPASN